MVHLSIADVTSADAKKILTTLLPEDLKRLAGRPRITWMKTVLNDLESSDGQKLTKKFITNSLINLF